MSVIDRILDSYPKYGGGVDGVVVSVRGLCAEIVADLIQKQQTTNSTHAHAVFDASELKFDSSTQYLVILPSLSITACSRSCIVPFSTLFSPLSNSIYLRQRQRLPLNFKGSFKLLFSP